MSSRLRVALVLLAGLSGCLPSRDNPKDPSNLPDVVVRLFDYTLADGRTCGDPLVGGPEVVAVSRGRCLALDASLTTDPQGDDLEDMRFSFAIDSGAGLSPAISTTGSIFVLDSDVRRRLPVGPEILIEARARDTDGSVGRAPVTLVLLNARPEAVPDPLRILPAAGWPWIGGGGFPVAFDGSRSTDPDGDDLDYCWTFPGLPEECREEPDDPFFLRSVPSQEGRYAARLVVTDGVERSAVTWSEVILGDPALWMASAQNYRVSRFDRPGQRFAANADKSWIVDGGTGPKLLISQFGGLTLAPLDDPAAGPAARPVTGNVLRASSSGGKIMVLVSGNAGDFSRPLTVVRFHADAGQPGGLALDWESARLEVDEEFCQELPEGSEADIAATPEGGAWVASRFYGDMVVLDSAGAIVRISEGNGPTTVVGDCRNGPFDGDHVYAGMEVRPNTSESWTAVSPFAPGPGNLPRLEVRTGLTVAPDRSFELPSAPSDVVFASENELWISFYSGGLFRLDAEMLDAGVPFDGAVLLEVPAFHSTQPLQVDPVTGGVWALEKDDASVLSVHNVDSDGTAFRYDEDIDNFAIQFIGLDGRLWGNDFDGLGGTWGPRSDRTLLTLEVPRPLSGSDRAAQDPSTGWLWTAVTLGSQTGVPPWALIAYAGDGTEARFVSSMQQGGQVLPLPRIDGLRLSPDGKSLFMIANAEANTVVPPQFYRLDLATDPPTLAAETLDPAVVDAIVGDVIGPNYSSPTFAFEPSAPDAAFLWSMRYVASPSSPNDVEVFTIDGTTLAANPPVLTLTGNEQSSYGGDGPWGALMPATNRLCLVTKDTGSSVFHVRFVSADGTVVLLPFNPSYSGLVAEASVATWADKDGNEACWIAYNSNLSPYQHVVMWVDGAGNFLGIFGGNDFMDSVVPISQSEAWITALDSVTVYVEKRRVTSPSTPLELDAEAGGTRFRGPFISPR